ncbi:hypothetical protein [Streptosporangium sp. KLBMP 9127]|nr:hypothetical protein [Streptosporangium sp. KLBMP 9127]
MILSLESDTLPMLRRSGRDAVTGSGAAPEKVRIGFPTNYRAATRSALAMQDLHHLDNLRDDVSRLVSWAGLDLYGVEIKGFAYALVSGPG